VRAREDPFDAIACGGEAKRRMTTWRVTHMDVWGGFVARGGGRGCPAAKI
jgi:hypothetical protein